MRYLVILGTLVLGCGSDAEAGAVTCERSDRSGTYLLSYETLGGTCGDLTSVVGRLDEAPLPDDCVSNAQDRWSEGDCKVERAFTCEVEPGQFVSYIAVSEQVDSEGDELTGTMTVILKDSTGAEICGGTYRLRAVRQ